MMREVFIEADNIISPIGLTTDENFRNLTQGISGIQSHEKQAFSATPFHASLFNELTLPATEAGFTKFENILIASIQNALQQSQVNLADPTTVMIISTTKGNVSLLETEDSKGWNEENISLHHSAQKIADHFGYKGLPVVISNACISGLAAMLVGKRLIESGQYQNAVVAGADMITKFVLSGFQSFQAVSDEPCRPFDESRKGITLGEAAATVILTTQKGTGLIRFSGGAVSNDANHISGPSRSGEELSMAINKTLRQAGINNNDIGFISAHGTATIYNDEMEAKAISLAGLESKPVNSLKGYYGHTLGAAGLLEAIVSIESLKNNLVLPTLGFTKSGVSKPIFINDKLIKAESQHCLKTASGFGGCNAALVFSKQQ